MAKRSKTKDLSERGLFSYPDVFADVLSGITGMSVDPNDLTPAPELSSNKLDGDLHEQIRDNVMLLNGVGGIRIALIGFENQTKIDQTMPIRTMGYDFADYSRQIRENKSRRGGAKIPFYPAITFVLYFGTERVWKRPSSLFDLMTIDDALKPFANDYKLNVVNVAFMENCYIAKFKSDFGTIAQLLANQRSSLDETTGLDDRDVVHSEEMLDLVTALTGSDKYITYYTEHYLKEGRKLTKLGEYMKSFETRARIEGEERGIAIGEERGIAIGEERGIAIGEERGIAIGEERGIALGRAGIVRVIVGMGREFHLTDDEIISRLVDELKCSREEASRMISEIDAQK